MTRPLDIPAAGRRQRAGATDGWRHRLRRVASVIRRMIGVPDYDTYLTHMREHYPECTPLDPRTFERERLTARYKATGSRCC